MEKKWISMIEESECKKQIDYARLAAFIDGEGWVSILRRKNHSERKTGNKNLTYSFVIGVANTSIPLHTWLEEIFGGKTYSRKNRENIVIKGEKTKQNKKAYQWHITSHDAIKLLKQIRPYLIIKGAQADLAFEFYNKYMKHPHKGMNGTPLWLLKYAEEYYNKMKELNSL